MAEKEGELLYTPREVARRTGVGRDSCTARSRTDVSSIWWSAACFVPVVVVDESSPARGPAHGGRGRAAVYAQVAERIELVDGYLTLAGETIVQGRWFSRHGMRDAAAASFDLADRGVRGGGDRLRRARLRGLTVAGRCPACWAIPPAGALHSDGCPAVPFAARRIEGERARRAERERRRRAASRACNVAGQGARPRTRHTWTRTAPRRRLLRQLEASGEHRTVRAPPVPLRRRYRRTLRRARVLRWA